MSQLFFQGSADLIPGCLTIVSISMSISISMSKSISMAKVSAISKGVCTVSKSITIPIGSIESISFWLSFSLTLSIVPGISKTITMTIAKRRVSESNMMTITITMSKRIGTLSKTISSVGMVKSFGISFRLSLTLGNMDNSSRVGNISASTGIGTMDSRDGSRGSTMDTYSVGNISNTITMVDRDGMDSMVDRGSMKDMVASIAKMSKMMPSIAVQSVSISSSKSCSASQKSYPDHV